MYRHSLAAFALLITSGLTTHAAEPAPLRVGMDTRSPPWSFVPGLDYSKEDPDKDPAVSPAQLAKVTGLDVDVAAALARRLGTTAKVVPVAWGELRQALIDRRIDVILNAFTPRSEPDPQLSITEPYFSWGLLVAARADDPRIQSFADLAGLTVGHFETNLVARTLTALNPRLLRPYRVQEALFEDLQAGKLDAVVYDSPYVRWRAKTDPAFRAVGEPLNKLGYHVAVRRADAALFARLQAAVKDLVTSGEAETIRHKWEER